MMYMNSNLRKFSFSSLLVRENFQLNIASIIIRKLHECNLLSFRFVFSGAVWFFYFFGAMTRWG